MAEPAFTTNSTNFVIGVLGEDKVFDVLKAATNLVEKRKLDVRLLSDVKGAENCHLLFVSEKEANKLPQLFAHLKDAGVLTVSDGKDFLRMGGMIRLWSDLRGDVQRFHFEINRDAARRANLNLSSQLLRLSESQK